MPGTEEKLTEEVRAITGSSSSINSLIEAAKGEIISETGNPDLVFFGDDRSEPANKALLWFTCYLVDSQGSSTSSGFSVGEIKVNSGSTTTENNQWLKLYERNINQIGGGFGMGSVLTQRDDREYSFDPPTDG